MNRAAVLLLIAFSVAMPLRLWAFSIGAYGDYSGSRVRYTYDEFATPIRVTRDHVGSSWSAGIVFDTDAARDVLVSYRLHFGVGSMVRRFPWQRLGMTSFAMHHAFGFGIWRTATHRLWVGPELGYGLGVSPRDNRDLEAFGTIGITGGINFHIGESVSCFLEGGFRYGLFAGDAKYIDGMWGHGFRWTVGAGVLFRFDDSYRYVEEL